MAKRELQKLIIIQKNKCKNTNSEGSCIVSHKVVLSFFVILQGIIVFVYY
ncbi:hypothetical protein JCM16816_21640 [Thermoanaerobacter brockii subsp. lactiethylicus]